MNNPAKSKATYADLLDVPAHRVAEILFGELHSHPRPDPKHALATSALDAKLFDPFHGGRGGSGGWWILVEPELHLGEHVIVPDLAGWQRERLPALPETVWFELAPDWVCEILSRSTAQTDRSIKMPLYADHDVAYLWLVDPDVKILEAYARHASNWLLLKTCKEGEAVGLAPFDAIEFSLAELWP